MALGLYGSSTDMFSVLGSGGNDFGGGGGGKFNFGGQVNMNPGSGTTGTSGIPTSGTTGATNLFPANGTTSGTPSSLTGGSLFPSNLGTPNISNIFGGLGPFLMNAIQTGGYNPDVFTALVNQLQPQVERGVSTIGANTGASGTRFGSGYDLALGDYLSQVNSNESAMAAGLYENAVQNSFNLLGSASGETAQFKSNQGGFTSSLITSLIGALGPTLLGKIPGLGGSSGGGGNSTPSTFPSNDPTQGIDWGSIIGDISGSTAGMTFPGNVNDPFGTGLIPGGG